MLILNSSKVQEFLVSIAFIDSKRPFTKKILERIDFKKIFLFVTFSDLLKTECELDLSKFVTEQMYLDFQGFVLCSCNNN